MADRKIIAVVGATGAQGGGLVRAVLAGRRGEFAVRALTRNPGSDKARALASAGAEVVAADLDDPASLERAFAGAHGAFCLTNFWEHFSVDRELAQAGNMARAAKSAGVRHVIWSTLEDTRKWVPLESDRMPTLQGKYKVPHFDGKGEAEEKFREAGVPTTFLLTAFYWENFIFFGLGPKPGADGVLEVTLPLGEAKLPGIASEDIGKCAHAIFQRGEEFVGKKVGIAGEHLSGAEMAAAMSAALGRKVRYVDVPPEVYRGYGFPGAGDLGNMFQFKRDFTDDFRRARSVDFTRSLDPELQSFSAWLERNKGQIPVE
ncbi:MAG: NmrA/HSCARG family protein [Gemmatimonadales bacterium]|nr:NmrA/HSCARG family protein [Gemmatimonadales bacterium]